MTNEAGQAGQAVQVLDPPAPTPAGPTLEARALVAANGNLDLAAEALQMSPAELLHAVLSDPHFAPVAEASMAFQKLRLTAELTDHISDTLDDMSPEAAGRLLVKLLEATPTAVRPAPAPTPTPAQPAQPVLIQNNFTPSNDQNEGGPTARERLSQRLAAVAVDTTAS